MSQRLLNDTSGSVPPDECTLGYRPRHKSYSGSMGNRTMSGRDFPELREMQRNRVNSCNGLSLESNEPDASELFPGDPTLQDLENKDRAWLAFRRQERLRQEKEDLAEYEARLMARKKSHYVKLNPPGVLDTMEPLISEEERKSFTIMVGIDKKKIKQHATGLVLCAYQNSAPGNKVCLYNCYQKNSSKRKEETTTHLERIKNQLSEYRSGLDISVATRHAAKPKHEEIIDYAVEHRVDMIVLGTKQADKNFFARKISPGVVDNCPKEKAVMLVPPPAGDAVDLDIHRNIILCFDATPHCQRALKYLAQIAKCTDRITVVNVVTPPPKLVVVAQADDKASLQANTKYDAILADRVNSADEIIKKARHRLVATVGMPDSNATTEIRILEGKKTVGDVILDIAKDISPDLIVLGARGIDGWQRVMQGTVTQPVLESSTRRSILIVR